jgi:anti-anti-sigma regulatory factor
MLKITKTETNGAKVILKLDGKITDQWAALLDGECRAAIRDGKRVELDCTGVDFVDSRGVQVLKSLPRKHLTLINAPGYMTELLRTGG